MPKFSDAELFYEGPIRLGEGVCWHAQRQALWWVDIVGQRLFESTLDGQPPRILECAQMIAAVAPTRAGGLVGAFHDGIHLVDCATGETRPFARAVEHDPREFRFNDAKVDPQGRLWAGTLALDGRSGHSRLYRIEANGAVAVMREGVTISNGLAWSPDGGTLYYIDSATRAVQMFTFDASNGSLGEPREALRFAEADGLPDGCAMDVEGNLWIAHWGGAKVTQWDLRTKRLLRTVHLPVRHVTSCAFGGPRRDRLYISTAMGESAGENEPHAGAVFQVHPNTVGLELACFAGE